VTVVPRTDLGRKESALSNVASQSSDEVRS
jgi:hypothetical protein